MSHVVLPGAAPQGQSAALLAPHSPHVEHLGRVSSAGVVAFLISASVMVCTADAGIGTYRIGLGTCRHAWVRRLAALWTPSSPSLDQLNLN